MAYIEFKDVIKAYGEGDARIHALDGASFTVERGELAIILGASGAGKTTALNILGGMDTATSGTVTVDGRDVSSANEAQLVEYRRADVGFVFQFYNLVPNLTALENVELAAQICTDSLDAEQTLRQVGLGERLGNFPAQLSGGEQQRVSIARALAKNPKLLLGDAADSGHDLDVYLCVFDKTAFEISSSIDKRLRAYIDDYYVAEHEDTLGSRTYDLLALQRFSDNKPKADRAVPSGVLDMPDFLGDMGETPVYSAPSAAPSPKSAGHVDDAVLSNLDEPFNIILLRLIDAKGYSDVEVYKRANINRKLFSKIRCGDGYMPSKKTVLALAIALRLNIDETQDILACAGYALSHSVKFDVIVEFFIVHEMFDVFTINEMLFRYDQPLLGQ